MEAPKVPNMRRSRSAYEDDSDTADNVYYEPAVRRFRANSAEIGLFQSPPTVKSVAKDSNESANMSTPAQVYKDYRPFEPTPNSATSSSSKKRKRNGSIKSVLDLQLELVQLQNNADRQEEIRIFEEDRRRIEMELLKERNHRKLLEERRRNEIHENLRKGKYFPTEDSDVEE